MLHRSDLNMQTNERTILLGEDDLEVRSYLEMALKCQGYSVEVAQDGEEVVAACARSLAPIGEMIVIGPRWHPNGRARAERTRHSGTRG